jgi:uncharacterized coiled-coil protein SlyX
MGGHTAVHGVFPVSALHYDDTPMDRRLTNEKRLTSIEVSLTHQDAALEQIQSSLREGFARVDRAHGEIRERLASQHDHLESLLATRKRQSAILKWAAGIVAAVVAALAMTYLRVK